MHHSKFEKLEDIQKIIDNETTFEEVLEFLNYQINQPWCESIKLGSEVEENSFEELEFVRKTFNKKLRFKVGGSGAKNDIKFAIKNKVNVITLPMAESRYAIENFLEIVNKYSNIEYKPLYAMNIETITIVNNLPVVKDLLSNFSSFTIGRSDLSGSMKVDVNSQDVDRTIVEVIRFIKSNFPAAKISIGGKITPSSSYHLVKNLKEEFDFINTKFFYIDLKYKDQIKRTTYEILKSEIALFSIFFKKGFRTKEELIDFSFNNIKRMNS